MNTVAPRAYVEAVSLDDAPAPDTAAAEIATPVLAELKALTADYQRRLVRSAGRVLEERRTRLTSAGRGLPRPADLLALASQRFDHASSRLGAGLERNVAVHRLALVRVADRLSPGLLDRPRRLRADRLVEIAARMRPAMDRFTRRAAERLESLDKLRLSFNPDGPLKRGFARVHHADGALARSAGALKPGEAVKLVFADGDRGAVVDGGSGPVADPRRPAPRAKSAGPGQGDLF